MGKKIEQYDNDVDIVNAILKTLYSGPREKLAEKLLSRFGSFHGIFRASQEDLLKVEGMTETSAAFFTAAVAEFRQALRREAKNIKPVSEYDLLYLAIAMDNESKEKYRVHIYTDAAGKILKTEKFTSDSVKKTVGIACGVNADRVAIVEYGRREKRLFTDNSTLGFISDAVNPLNAVGIEFIDYMDYIGNKFATLRRAIKGDAAYNDLSAASKEKYPYMPNIIEQIKRMGK